LENKDVSLIKWKRNSTTSFMATKEGEEVGEILKLKARYWVFHDSLSNSPPFLKLIQAVRFLKSIAIAS